MRKLLILSCTLVFLGCSKTRDLHKLKPTSQIALPQKEVPLPNSSEVEIIIADPNRPVNQSQVLHGEITSEGDIQGNVELGEIKVVARSKRVPERAGKVLIEFVVDIPKTLFRKDWQLALFPKLRNEDSIAVLRPMVMTGNEFRRKQERQYESYNNYLQSLEIDPEENKDRFLNKKMYGKYLNRQQFFLEKYNAQIKREYSAFLYFNKILQDRNQLNGKPLDSNLKNFKRNSPVSWFSFIPYAKENRLKLLDGAQIKGWGPELKYALSESDSLHAYSLFWNKKAYDDNNKKLAKLKDTYEKIVEYPIYENAYLDTIVAGGKHQFFYEHYVEASESSPKMYLALDGAVTATDGSTYHFKAQDTLTYFVSSMTNFIDRSPRFKRKINLRAVQAELSVNLLFPAGKIDVADTLATNERELERLKNIYSDLISNKDLVVDSIIILAGSSPEGSWKFNDVLSQQRASKVSEFIMDYFSDYPQLREVSKPYSISENWTLLEELLGKDSLLVDTEREGILNQIQTIKDPDLREAAIIKSYPQAYNILKDKYYPQLRRISFMFHLHRAGFAKDTVYTNEPDTDYAKGIDLLDKRRYKDALAILREYDDINTAVAHMSLGHDQQAMELLKRQKSTADVDYMLAILHFRTGKEKDALLYYQRACEVDPSKIFRGNLDPEIQKLKSLFNIE